MKPEKTFRLGTVNAAVFKNSGKDGDFRTITLQRRFQDADGKWESSTSYTATQAASAMSVLQNAVAYVMEQDAAGRGQAADEA